MTECDTPLTPESQTKSELLFYSKTSGVFEPALGITALTTLDLLRPDGQAPLESAEPTFVDVKMYDIPRTVIRALEQLAARFSDCYATVFGSSDMLQECVAANTGVKLIAVTTLPPDEIDDVDKWKHDYGAVALEAGCSGVLVDFDCRELVAEYPDRYFFTCRAL